MSSKHRHEFTPFPWHTVVRAFIKMAKDNIASGIVGQSHHELGSPCKYLVCAQVVAF